MLIFVVKNLIMCLSSSLFYAISVNGGKIYDVIIIMSTI